MKKHNLTHEEKVDLILYYCNKYNKQLMLSEYDLPTDETILDEIIEVIVENDTYYKWIKDNRSNRLKMINNIL